VAVRDDAKNARTHIEKRPIRQALRQWSDCITCWISRTGADRRGGAAAMAQGPLVDLV
jgi:hypothetical protein